MGETGVNHFLEFTRRWCYVQVVCCDAVNFTTSAVPKPLRLGGSLNPNIAPICISEGRF